MGSIIKKAAIFAVVLIVSMTMCVPARAEMPVSWLADLLAWYLSENGATTWDGGPVIVFIGTDSDTTPGGNPTYPNVTVNNYAVVTQISGAMRHRWNTGPNQRHTGTFFCGELEGWYFRILNRNKAPGAFSGTADDYEFIGTPGALGRYTYTGTIYNLSKSGPPPRMDVAGTITVGDTIVYSFTYQGNYDGGSGGWLRWLGCYTGTRTEYNRRVP